MATTQGYITLVQDFGYEFLFKENKFLNGNKKSCINFTGQDIDDKVDLLAAMISDILNRNALNVNMYQFKKFVFEVSNADPHKITGMVFVEVKKYASKIHTSLQQMIDDSNFTIEKFYRHQKDFNDNFETLIGYLDYYNDVLRNSTVTDKYNVIKMMKNVLFYTDVINLTYTEYGKKVYLYTYLAELINKNNISLDNLEELYKTHKYYMGLSFVLGVSKDKYFNESVDQGFIEIQSNNSKFVQELVSYIDEKIRIIQSCKSKKQKFELQESLFNTAKMTTYFKDKTLLGVYYNGYFGNRILNPNFDSEMEERLIKSIFTKKDIVTNKMIHMINDVHSSKYISAFPKIKIRIGSDKYKSIDMDSLDPSIVTVQLLRSTLWKDFHVNTEYNIPIEINAYQDIYKLLYKSFYPRRIVKWNHKQSTGVIELNLNKREYLIQATMEQIYILMNFNDQAEWSAYDLSKTLNIGLSTLGEILNSLIMTGLVVHGDGELNDPNIKFSLNNEFTHPHDKISIIVGLLNKQEQVSQINEVDLLRTLLETFKQFKQCTHTQMFSEIHKKFPSIPNEIQLLDKIVTSAISDGYIKKSDANGLISYDYLEPVFYNSDSEDEPEKINNADEKVEHSDKQTDEKVDEPKIVQVTDLDEMTDVEIATIEDLTDVKIATIEEVD